MLLTVAPFLMEFSLDNAIVPRSDILSGGPPKDGIPALLAPTFVGVGESDFMNPDDMVGVTPIQIVLSADGQVGDVLDDQSRPVPVIFAYWFAWQAFHPQTAVYTESN